MIPIAKPLIDHNEKRRVMEVLDSGMISIGKVVREFEERFAEFAGSKYALAASSGTTALHLSLAASGLKEGDKVLTTPFSFIATANSMLYCGMKPVFCDIEKDTFNIDPDSIEQALECHGDIKGLMIVHLFGHPCDMDRIMKIVEKHDLVLIEDCAQAHGAYYRQKHVGTFGQSGTFSFYPTKNMTTAEGGMIITDSEEVFNRLKLLREHGDAGGYNHRMLGYNFRMTNIEAAIGLGQLEKLKGFNSSRRENAKFYDISFKDIPWLKIPVEKQHCLHCYHQYSMRVKDRDRFAQHLKDNGVGYKIYYPSTIPEQPLYKEMGFDGSVYPVSQKAAGEIISIPVHPAITADELKTVAEAVKEFVPAAVETTT